MEMNKVLEPIIFQKASLDLSVKLEECTRRRRRAGTVYLAISKSIPFLLAQPPLSKEK